MIICCVAFSVNAQHDYCDVLKKSLMFYKAQRAGRLPDNDIPWRGNSVLNDSSPGSAKDANGDGNLSKGYFDAGDHVKFALPMAYTITMLAWSFIQFESNVEQCGLSKLFLEDIKWGSDWLIAAHVSEFEFAAQVGNGEADHSFWGPPELLSMDRPVYMINTNSPGTEVACEAAAALAATSIVFSKRDPQYASLCLTHSKQLHNFGDKYRGVYSDVITDAQAFYKSWSGYKDEIVWSSIWLFKATSDQSYLTKAKSDYATFGIGGMAQQNSHDWDLKAPGVALLMYQMTGDSNYQRDIESFLKWWMPGGGISFTNSGGLSWIRQWGPNRYVATASFLAIVYGGQNYINWAQSQVSYLLGNNPLKISYVVGVGSKFPLNPHHRAAHHSTTNNIAAPVLNTYELTGALVGGPSQDDSYTDDRTDFVRNEVACDYNAGLVGVIAGLVNKDSKPVQTTTAGPTQAPSNNPITNPPVTPSKPQSSYQIYLSGELKGNFNDWSWGSNSERNFKDTTHMFNGQYSIAFTPNYWNAIYLGCASMSGISTANYNYIQFYINGGDYGRQQLIFAIFRKGATVVVPIQKLVGSDLKPNEWSKVIIKLSDYGIGSSETINGMWIQATTPFKQSTVYIADLKALV
ncbi:cellulase [Tieghemostelium lacteum]|uniref:Endoglucanase n=1 Tax=Tieghemostelium lacteum TaxID=361077 RepID=A0A152A3E2_TIELA|nr:cellulase [Tieghemostelium lacteum]|eukprot:KYR00625.1 cellulase [Tieghemostelium lacteum]